MGLEAVGGVERDESGQGQGQGESSAGERGRRAGRGAGGREQRPGERAAASKVDLARAATPHHPLPPRAITTALQVRERGGRERKFERNLRERKGRDCLENMCYGPHRWAIRVEDEC